LWHKGETSGNKQRVVAVTVDCDHDALRVLVIPEGPACHTGAQTCFHNELQERSKEEEAGTESTKADLGEVLNSLYNVIESRKRERPEGSYTTYLFEQGLDKILKKVGEECAETIIAAKNDDQQAFANESADLLYHLLVLFVQRGVTLDEVQSELFSRRGKGSK
jgi:phosphoribosyl-ATP pyrophosphohydrolase/phosphoribosyl-AMP cyclohydrolase